ncbi:hypothetical protein D3C87_233020 [compost metagenome]
MSDLTKFSDGASILQQVDVSSIFKSLAMGIAEAQQKLDDNSIAQAVKLAETTIDGVSLLELGFVPVFYAFQYADISASINLQMAMKQELEFGFGLEIELATKKGYSEDDRTFIGQDSYEETQKEYTAKKEVTFRAGVKNSVTIENHAYTLNENLQAKSRIESLKEEVLAKESNIEQIYDEIKFKKLTEDKSRGIDVWVDGGYLRVETGLNFQATNGVGILKIADYGSNQAIDLNGAGSAGNFNLDGDIVSTLEQAEAAKGSGGTIYGISKSGALFEFHSGSWKPISSKFYFAYNRDDITYGKDLSHDGDAAGDVIHPAPVSGFVNMNHNRHTDIHKVLRMIQKHDPKAVITVTGVTDPKGGSNPNNQSLAKRRAERLRNHIFGTGNAVNVVTGAMNNPNGGSDLKERYATVTLNADYIVFIGGAVNKSATPGKTAEDANKFVYTDHTSDGNFEKMDVKYGDIALAYSIDESGKNIETLAQFVKGKLKENSYEKIDGRHYFLEDEAVVKFYLLTNKSEDIKVEHQDESSSEGTENTNSFISSKTKNKKSLLGESLNKKSKDSSFALGASVDFRLSRQFEMSMEGNSAMSARLVAAPAPAGFLNFVQNAFSNGSEE